MATIKYILKFNKNYFEKKAWEENKLICGIDEVGRGCLAGPVVVGAVILHPGKISRLIKDSKLLNPEQRQRGYSWVIKNSWYGIGIVHNRNIDKYNIYHATLIAMKRAFMQLMIQCPHQPNMVLVDAMPLQLKHTAFENIDVIHFPFGERRSTSIAAASILAKVYRDEMMKKIENIFPGYHLARHKGYSTPQHKKSVKAIGHTIIHRINFLRYRGLLTLPEVENDKEEQQSLCRSN